LQATQAVLAYSKEAASGCGVDFHARCSNSDKECTDECFVRIKLLGIRQVSIELVRVAAAIENKKATL